MTSAPHPAAAALLDAAKALAAYQPTTPADLAWLLRSIHDHASDESLLDLLSAALYAWANDQDGNYRANGESIAAHLNAADELLEPVGAAIDQARADTGHWNAGENGGAS